MITVSSNRARKQGLKEPDSKRLQDFPTTQGGLYGSENMKFQCREAIKYRLESSVQKEGHRPRSAESSGSEEVMP